jgi:alpha-L-fucosidase
MVEKICLRFIIVDGFTLWPSRVKNPYWKDEIATVSRDIVGELTRAVKKRNMKMGFYYSGGIDWSWHYEPITRKGQENKTPPQPEYGEYADSHYRELIEKYDPDILWNDINYPKHGKLKKIFAEFYNKNPEGVVNDRFTQMWYDFTTPEYKEYEYIEEKKWESCRGLGYSFGFNRNEEEEHTISEGDLIKLLCNIVSMNGNLLLNVGPQADGTIPPLQLKRLEALGNWLKVNGEAIFETRPWFNPNIQVNPFIRVAFTAKYQGDITVALYLLVFLPQIPPNFVDVPVNKLRPETFGKGFTINDLKFELLSISGTTAVPVEIENQIVKIPISRTVQQNEHVIVYKISRKSRFLNSLFNVQ